MAVSTISRPARFDYKVATVTVKSDGTSDTATVALPYHAGFAPECIAAIKASGSYAGFQNMYEYGIDFVYGTNPSIKVRWNPVIQSGHGATFTVIYLPI